MTTFSDYQINAMALAVCVAHNVNLILWGNPGHGKTSVITQTALNYGFHLEVIVANLEDPTGFGGTMIERDMVTYKAPPRFANDTVKKYNEEGKKTIIMYDEISTAPPATQAALLRVALERVAGELQMPLETRSIGTANPPSIAADGWELTPPTANRFTHITWALDAELVADAFIKGGFPNIQFPRMAKNIQRYYAHAKQIVGAFLLAHPQLLDTLDEKTFGMTSSNKKFTVDTYAFATPRSWEQASIIYGGILGMRLPDGSPIPDAVTRKLIYGTIGTQAGKAFMTYVKASKIQDAELVISGQEQMIQPDRIDIASVMLANLEYAYLSKQPTVDRWNNFGDALAALYKLGYGDTAHSFARRWYVKRPPNAMLSTQHAEHLMPIIRELERG